jgi:hypothetical protein
MGWLEDLSQRKTSWEPWMVPPESLRRYAFPLRKDIPNSPLAVAAGPATIVPAQTDDALMSSRHVISTGDMDRAGDQMSPEGCYLGNYDRNPVVFFGHQQFPLPIGKSKRDGGPLAVQIVPGQYIEATCFYSQVNPDAADIYAMVKEGTLGMTSIGFNPISRPVPIDPGPGSAMSGYRFDRWELLEWSIVGIPCNPYCEHIRSHLSRGKVLHGGGHPISPMLRKSLEMLASPQKEWAVSGFKAKQRDSQGNIMACKKSKTPLKSRKVKDGTAASAPAAPLSSASGTGGGYAVPEGRKVHRVRCMKSVFPERPEAEEKVKSLGYKADNYQDNPGSDDPEHDSPPSHDFLQTKADDHEGAFDQDDHPEHEGVKMLHGAVRKAEVPPADDPELDQKPGGTPANPKRGKLVVKCAACPPKKDMDLNTPLSVPETEQQPNGATCAQAITEHLEEEIATLEPECVEFWQGILDQIREWAGGRYPDLDLGGDQTGEDDTGAPKTTEDEADSEIEAAQDRYMLAGVPANIKPHVVTFLKRMSKRATTVVKGAADHLDNMGGLPDEDFSRDHRKACKDHASGLRGIIKDFDAEGDGGGGDADGSPSGDKAITEAVSRATREALSPLREQIYRMTGKKLG